MGCLEGLKAVVFAEKVVFAFQHADLDLRFALPENMGVLVPKQLGWLYVG